MSQLRIGFKEPVPPVSGPKADVGSIMISILFVFIGPGIPTDATLACIEATEDLERGDPWQSVRTLMIVLVSIRLLFSFLVCQPVSVKNEFGRLVIWNNGHCWLFLDRKRNNRS